MVGIVTVEQLRKLHDAATAAREGYDAAAAALHRAIAEAMDDGGATAREIAERIGVSIPRVYQLRDKGRTS